MTPLAASLAPHVRQIRHVDRIIGRNFHHPSLRPGHSHLSFSLHTASDNNDSGSDNDSECKYECRYQSPILPDTLNPSWESLTRSQFNAVDLRCGTQSTFIVRFWQTSIDRLHGCSDKINGALKPFVLPMSDDGNDSASDRELLFETRVELSELVLVHSPASAMHSLPQCPVNTILIALVDDGVYVPTAHVATLLPLYRPAKSLMENNSAVTRAIVTDIDECLMNVTVLMRLRQSIVSTETDLLSIHHQLTQALQSQSQAHCAAQQRQRRAAKLAELRELIDREQTAIASQRNRVLEQRRAMVTKVHGLRAKLTVIDTITQIDFPNSEDIIHESVQTLRYFQSSVSLRRRKLLYQLSLLFPITPLHSKRERERQKRKLRARGSGASRSQSPNHRNRNGTSNGNVSDYDSSARSHSHGHTVAGNNHSQLSHSLSSTFSLSLTSHLPPARFYRIGDAILPPFTSLLSHSDEHVSTALGLISLLVALIAKYTNIPTRYKLQFRGSRSLLIDECEESRPSYPLYGRHVDTVKFEYGVYFLNQNIEYLLNESVKHWQVNLHVNANTGEKLRILLDGLIGLL